MDSNMDYNIKSINELNGIVYLNFVYLDLDIIISYIGLKSRASNYINDYICRIKK